MTVEFNQKIEARMILRSSASGRYSVVETINADYALIDNKQVIAIYRNKTDVYAAYGRLTRAEKENQSDENKALNFRGIEELIVQTKNYEVISRKALHNLVDFIFDNATEDQLVP